MSRYAYIPLDFSKIEQGLEREILIKRDTDDLFVLDDYKVPVSSTKNLRKDIEGIEDGVDEMFTDMEGLENKFRGYIEEIIKLGITLDELIESTENNYFVRIIGLESYKNYLQTLFEEVQKSFIDIKDKLDSVVRNYKEDLKIILDAVRPRYTSNQTLYNKFSNYEVEYKAQIISMENEIAIIKQKLTLKMLKLGTGSGSFSGSKLVDTTVTLQFGCWFYWLSNNPNTVYYGDSWYSPPRIPEDYTGVNNQYNARIWYKPPQWSDRETIDNFRGNQNSQEFLVSCSWNGPVVDGGYISETPLYNKYGRRCDLLYQKSFGSKETRYFNYEVK